MGGRLVYSTCSLNPIENEAVVARLLTIFGSDCIRLVDVSDSLPGLVRQKGRSSWKVWHRGQWHETYQSVIDRFPQKCPTKLESCFPPLEPAEIAKLNLDRCLRMAPHEQDCGGFFVAVIEKLAEHDPRAGALDDDEPEVCVTEGGSILPEALSTNPTEKGPSKSRTPAPAAPASAELVAQCAEHAGVLHAVGGASLEAAAASVYNCSYAPLFVPNVEAVAKVRSFFGVTSSEPATASTASADPPGGFPSHQLVARSPTARTLLLLSREVLGFLRSDTAGVLKVVSTGVRIFERDEAKGSECAYRACQDGLSHLLEHTTKQRVPISANVARRLLMSSKPFSTDEMESDEDLKGLSTALQTTCQPGSVMLAHHPANGEPPIAIAALFSKSGSVSPMVKGIERQGLLFRLGVDEAPALEEDATGSD